ncbi:ABC transporter ATP-binding protein [Bacillaceae bacterium JMAK1]|nr:ABC transporter ATP-binding protein [Bacillaceae bacterium JMAK1]
MIVCHGKNIEQVYGGTTIFTGLSFQIHSGETIGLVGRNGEGKSTLARLIAGLESPTTGTIGWKKESTKGMLVQTPERANITIYDLLQRGFSELNQLQQQLRHYESQLSNPNNTDLEATLNTYGALLDQFEKAGGYVIKANIRRVAAGLGISNLLDKCWSTLSGGERTKVELAELLLQKPDLLILDEPTNHLDIYALDWLSKWIKDYTGSVLIISHDRAFLDDTVTKIWELDDGELFIYHTNYTDYVKEREARILRQFQHYEDQQKKIKKMTETIKRLKEWANRAKPPNASMHRQAKSMEKALHRIKRLQRPVETKQVALAFDSEQRSGNDVFKCDNIVKHFGTTPIFNGLSLHIRHGERVAIVGPNGAGKSTLLKTLLQHHEVDEGEVSVGHNISIGYLSQHLEFGTSTDTVLSAFRDAAMVSEAEARHILAKFLFYGYDVFTSVSDLSGGESMRLRLAQLMQQHHNVLVFDEPTNHLDIDSKEMLEEALESFQGTIVAVSHDRYFLNKSLSTTLWLEDGKLTRYEGSFNYARMKRSE